MGPRRFLRGPLLGVLVLLVGRAVADEPQVTSGIPGAPADWSRAKDIDEANRKFVEWQTEMLRASRKAPPELARVLARKSVVPPLPAGPSADPPMTDLDIPVFPGRAVRLSVGEPDVTFSLGVEGKVLDLVGGSYSAGATYSCRDDRVVFGRSGEVKGILFTDGKTEVAGAYEYHSATWGQPSREETGAEKEAPIDWGISVDLGTIGGGVSYNTDREVGVTVGYDLLSTPERISRYFELKLGVELEITAPFELKGWIRKEDGRIRSGEARRLARILAAPVSCPHCAAKGELDCGHCGNGRFVVCPDCGGSKRAGCGRCEGSGSLYCTRCIGHSGEESCSSCGGSGALRCSGCSGSGQVTTYETETRSRQEMVVTAAGFDENGNPYYDRHWETTYYTVEVPRASSCGSCGGSGAGGQCGSCAGDGRVTCGTCGGGGTVDCGWCGGSGDVSCGGCGGSGRIACPGCGGRPIVCPLCRGIKSLGRA